MQWKVLQAGCPHTHVGKTLARLNPRLSAPHGDPHLDAVCGQRQEGLLCVGAEGRQWLSERSGQRVSGACWRLICVPVTLLCGKGTSNALRTADYRFAKWQVCVCKCATARKR